MEMMDRDFFKEILSIFKGESQEHIQAIKEGMDQLVNSPPMDDQNVIMESVHRAAHSLKGAARTVGLTDIEPMCQSLESAFSLIKREKLSIPADLINLFNVTVDQLSQILSSIDDEGKITVDKSELARFIEEITNKIATLS